MNPGLIVWRRRTPSTPGISGSGSLTSSGSIAASGSVSQPGVSFGPPGRRRKKPPAEYRPPTERQIVTGQVAIGSSGVVSGIGSLQFSGRAAFRAGGQLSAFGSLRFSGNGMAQAGAGVKMIGSVDNTIPLEDEELIILLTLR